MLGICASFIDTAATEMGRTFRMTVKVVMQWTLCGDANAINGRTLTLFEVGAIVLEWEGLLASSDFEVVRLKNKIGELKKPFNMHVNVLFKPEECEDPILCEVQFCLREVFDLMHCDHLLYEVVRAKWVGDLL